jgi:hypothetical protein
MEKGMPRRVNLNDDGSLDEVVGHGHFHIEQLDDHCWFINLDGFRFNFCAIGGTLRKPKLKVIPTDFNTVQDLKEAWLKGETP